MSQLQSLRQTGNSTDHIILRRQVTSGGHMHCMAYLSKLNEELWNSFCVSSSPFVWQKLGL